MPVFEIGLPLLLDGGYLGDVTVEVSGETVRIRAESLVGRLSRVLTEDAVAAVNASARDGYVQADGQEIAGLTFAYDPAEQQITVTTPLDLRERRTLSIGARPLPPLGDFLEPGDVSLFLNTFSGVAYDWNNPTGDGGFLGPFGSLELGGRLFGTKGVSFLSRHSYSTDGGFELTRSGTVLLYDMPERLLSAAAGDLRLRGQGFQRVPLIAGLSLERNLRLQPERQFRPVADRAFDVERPSTVEIRINGVVQETYVLQPGRFDVGDIPLGQGSNLVEVVLRDDLGRETILSDTNYFDFNLLERGLWDFSLAAGVKTRFGGSGGIGYTDEPVVSGFVRYGLTNEMTVGADVQGDASGFNAGATGLFATRLGITTSNVAISDYDGTGSGYAAEVAHRFIGDFSNDVSWSLSASAEHLSARFEALGASQFGTRLRLDSSGGLSIEDEEDRRVQPFSLQLRGNGRVRWRRVTTSLSGTYSRARGPETDRYGIFGGISYALFPDVSVGLFGSHTKGGLRSESSALVQVDWRIGRNRALRSQFDTGTNEVQARYSRQSERNIGGLRYTVGGRSDLDDGIHQLSGSASYVANRFETNLDHSVVQLSGTGSGTRQSTRVALASSLVFVDGTFGIGRPVGGSFAILRPHDSLKGRTLLGEPTADGALARSGALGPAVLPEGQAFSTRPITYDVEDLPPGYDLGAGQVTVRPPIYAGYRVTVGSDASFTVSGRIIDSAGKPMRYVGGSIQSLDEPEADPIPAFSNRNGRLAATGLKPGRYVLTLRTEAMETTTFTISDDDDVLIDIGTLQVESEP